MKRRASFLLLVVPVLAMFFASNAAASWTIQTTPNPGSTANEFSEVSCAGATSCNAVGRYAGSEGFKGLFAAWNGASWGTSATEGGPPPSDVEDVSCVANSSVCMAVGLIHGTEVEVGISSRTSGSTWTNSEAPRWSEGPGRPLHGVSCVSTVTCVAVGQDQRSGTKKTLVETLVSGLEWKIVTSPNPAGSEPSLIDVSCTSSTSCMAVGQYQSGGSTLTLAEQYNGTEWKIIPTPNMGGVALNTLSAISCTTSNACTAVGRYGGFATKPLVERWNGTSWTIQSTPVLGETSQLSGVSCTSSTACTAVGSYASLSQTPVAMTWNGSTWTTQAVATPTLPANSYLKGSLSGVSCLSATVCTAVGSYRFVTGGTPGQIKTLAERSS